jgi:adenine-specific DNA-methyltransferase
MRKNNPRNLKMVIELNSAAKIQENIDYLTTQIITYIGNKRALLKHIDDKLQIVRKKLGQDRIKIFDVFTGSGIVARYFKRYSTMLVVNDLERYATLLAECYLSNTTQINISELQNVYAELTSQLTDNNLREGFITELYAPKDDDNIQAGERVFYTHRNAMYLDTARQLIDDIDENLQKYFLAPLITEASVHTNTSGIFKGFHKGENGIGKFGGGGADALFRIKSNIELPFPVFSSCESEVKVYNGDANEIVKDAPEVDFAYLDPPYNQHPYGSNYFMLNLLADYKRPQTISKISGIPTDWKHSDYNKKQTALKALDDLASNIKAKYVLLSFNSEGFITVDEIQKILERYGKVERTDIEYNTFRGSRNLSDREVHVDEYLYLLEK